MIQIGLKLVGMPMIFYCNKLNLSTRKGSQLASMRQNINSNFLLFSMFLRLFFIKKMLFLKFVGCIKTKFTKCHGPKLSGESFASTSEV
jgi:hypothetical protein